MDTIWQLFDQAFGRKLEIWIMAYRSNIDDHSKIRNMDYGIPVEYRRPFVHIEPPFTLQWTGRSIQLIFSLGIFFLLVGLGNGDIGNNDQNVKRFCACKHLYIV